MAELNLDENRKRGITFQETGKINEGDLLSEFFSAIREDYRISITHIGIYAALVEYWRKQGFSNPIRAFSRDIMGIAKISASTTYHKCIRDLDEYGYIKYEPSFRKDLGSKIYFKGVD